MFQITDAMNTYNKAIDMIYTKQYILYTLKDDEDYILYLEKKNFRIAGSDPFDAMVFIPLFKMQMDRIKNNELPYF